MLLIWMKSVKTTSCGISGLTLKEPWQLYHHWDCDWLCSWPIQRQPSWDFGSSSQKTRTMSSDFISVWLPAPICSEWKQDTQETRSWCSQTPLPHLPSFDPPTLSPEVSGVQSSCHQGQGVKISVWFRFPERRIRLEENQKVVRPSKPPLPLENARVLQGLHHRVVCATFHT